MSTYEELQGRYMATPYNELPMSVSPSQWLKIIDELAVLRETVRVLGEECKAANEDVESCCDALDHLSSHATIGPAILANLDEAGRNEIEARREYARKVLRNTHNWKKAEAQMIADELADPGARAAVEGAQ